MEVQRLVIEGGHLLGRQRLVTLTQATPDRLQLTPQTEALVIQLIQQGHQRISLRSRQAKLLHEKELLLSTDTLSVLLMYQLWLRWLLRLLSRERRRGKTDRPQHES